MSDELDLLYYIANFFKRVNAKLTLMELLSNAKKAYDKYDFISGKEALLEALQLEPRNPVTLRGLGCIEQYYARFDEAINYYKLALQYSTKKEIEYTLLGTVYYMLDKLDTAIEYFNMAIKLNDNYTEAYEGRNQAMLENHLQIIDVQEMLKKYF